MRRIALTALLALSLIATMNAMASPQRAAPGAGWSPTPVAGQNGEQVFHRYCWDCHGDGPDHPGTDALQAKYHGDPSARLDRRTDLNADYVTYIVRHGISVMPSIRKTEIGDAELKAIAQYLTRKRR